MRAIRSSSPLVDITLEELEMAIRREPGASRQWDITPLEDQFLSQGEALVRAERPSAGVYLLNPNTAACLQRCSWNAAAPDPGLQDTTSPSEGSLPCLRTPTWTRCTPA